MTYSSVLQRRTALGKSIKPFLVSKITARNVDSSVSAKDAE